jgi:superoxide dismutase, Cu-Zn family
LIHYDQDGLNYFAHKIYRCSTKNIDRKEKGMLPKGSRKAMAELLPGPLAPNIKGHVIFKEVPGGTEVTVEVTGLPEFQPALENSAQIGPHGFHIHEYGNIEVGDASNPFPSTGGHWNPTNDPHGNHAGDFPVLFSNHGCAATTFFTDKFRIADIINRSVVIHQSPDDYRSQPAGNSGKKLSAGIIKPIQ